MWCNHTSCNRKRDTVCGNFSLNPTQPQASFGETNQEMRNLSTKGTTTGDELSDSEATLFKEGNIKEAFSNSLL